MSNKKAALKYNTPRYFIKTANLACLLIIHNYTKLVACKENKILQYCTGCKRAKLVFKSVYFQKSSEKKMQELRRVNGTSEKKANKRTSVEAGLDLNNITPKTRRRTTRNKWHARKQHDSMQVPRLYDGRITVGFIVRVF